MKHYSILPVVFINFLILNCDGKNFTNDDSAKMTGSRKNLPIKVEFVKPSCLFSILLIIYLFLIMPVFIDQGYTSKSKKNGSY